jgi:hypothetical protein
MKTIKINKEAAPLPRARYPETDEMGDVDYMTPMDRQIKPDPLQITDWRDDKQRTYINDNFLVDAVKKLMEWQRVNGKAHGNFPFVYDIKDAGDGKHYVVYHDRLGPNMKSIHDLASLANSNMKIIKTSQPECCNEDLAQTFRANLKNICEYARKLQKMDIEHIEGWVMDKISTASDDISEVKHYYADKMGVEEEEVEDIDLESKLKCWKGYERVKGKEPGEDGSCKKKSSVEDGILRDLTASAEADGLFVEAAEYQGKKVELNKPMRGDVKKFKVYVKNDKGNVVKVNFGDKNMEIKRDDPERRKNYRARHNCSNPGPKWKANYWSCKMWGSKSVSDILGD